MFRNQYWTHSDISIAIKNGEKQWMKYDLWFKDDTFIVFSMGTLKYYDENSVVDYTALFWMCGTRLNFSGNIEDLR